MELAVFFFDMFNTVLSLHHATKEELKLYSDHLAEYYRTGVWKRFNPPKSWSRLGAWNDASEMIRRVYWDLYLNSKLVVLSNCPVSMMTDILRNTNLPMDYIIPLEAFEVFKPKDEAYAAAEMLMNVKSEQCWMITANRTFGDLEAASRRGWNTVYINRKDEIIPPHEPLPSKTHDCKNMMDFYERFCGGKL